MGGFFLVSTASDAPLFANPRRLTTCLEASPHSAKLWLLSANPRRSAAHSEVFSVVRIEVGTLNRELPIFFLRSHYSGLPSGWLWNYPEWEPRENSHFRQFCSGLELESRTMSSPKWKWCSLKKKLKTIFVKTKK